MSPSKHTLSALLGSRICHDLISPIGAIGNGVELLGMTGTVGGPELELISASALNANARIRFFRIAYGLSSEEQRIGRREIMGVLSDFYSETRFKVQWAVTQDCLRAEARLTLLLLQCLESALPLGGAIHITQTDTAWRLQAEAEKTKIDESIWALLAGGEPNLDTLGASQVQFALAPLAAKDMNRTVRAELSESRIALTF